MDEGGNSTRKVVEKLDVEDEETRQTRIQSYLEKLNSSSHTTNLASQPAFQTFDFGDRTTFDVKPPTDLLSRVQAFLPQLEASNAVLAQRAREDPNSIDIEHIPEGMDQYIEMNLGLGIFEDRSHKSAQCNEDSEMSISSSSNSSDISERDNDPDSDMDSEASSEIITCFAPYRPIRPLPRRHNRPRPEIVILEEAAKS
ncbi:hypothetical protein BYT27DRAFT_7137134 [Phlegmacium glaucopus]|nr:hypothetical protein BYT27DRAFT_7137134 [Phlegmacium glaucopus]